MTHAIVCLVDGGTESLGITAGETKNPSKNMPKVVKFVFWRFVPIEKQIGFAFFLTPCSQNLAILHFECLVNRLKWYLCLIQSSPHLIDAAL